MADDRAIRVCLVGPSLDVPGGQAVQAARLSRGLSEHPAITLTFVPINPRLPGPLRLLQRVRYVRTVVTAVRYVGALINNIMGCDVVHVFSASYWSFVLSTVPVVALARWFRKPVIVNYRSGEAEDHLRRWRRTALPTLRRATAVVVPSGYLRELFARVGIDAQIVPNLIDVGRFHFRERQPLRPVFLSNRHLERDYNVACVLRAFAHIQRHYPAARLIVVGDGSQRRALQRLAAELRLDHTEFVGRVAPERMVGHLDAADVYLNAPDVDNMPSSILEAFASGLAVVTTDAGGIPHIVRHGETGLIVPRGADEAMAAAALRLFREPALAGRLAATALEECRRRYAPAVVLAAWVRVYEGLARREPRLAVRDEHPVSASSGR